MFTCRTLGFAVGQCFSMLYIPSDRVHHAELRTDLHFAETSSRPIKAALKAVKIDIFCQQNLPEEREIDQTCLCKSFLKLKVNANGHKNFENRSIRTPKIFFQFSSKYDEN